LPPTEHDQLNLDEQLGRVAQLRQRIPEAADQLPQASGIPGCGVLLQPGELLVG
jgi:hypothetical protein